MNTPYLRASVETRTATVVAPQLIAQSALLELGYAELESRIGRELDENPALDRDEKAARARPIGPGQSLPRRAALPAGGLARRSGSSAYEDDPGRSLEDVLRSPYTLQDDLCRQFRLASPPELHALGQRLIADIDQTGYLHCDLFDVAREMDVPLAQVQAAVECIQRLDPAGVGARSLQECLLLQVRRLRAEGVALVGRIEEVIGACSLVTGADLVGQVARALGCRRAEVQTALEQTRRLLYPFPGYTFEAAGHQAVESPGCVYPDVLIRREGERFGVEIPVSQSQELRLSEAYLALEQAHRRLRGRQTSASEQRAREQLQRAREFLGMLQRREQVMRRIAETVVRCQEQYLLCGPMFHKPLSKKEIAQLTGLHEAIVCRATKGKYAMLPGGEVVEFDSFFEPAVPVKQIISQLVRKETPKRPLSDKQLATSLAEQGYVVARRTVAKYRQALQIPSSARRRARAGGTR